METLMPLIERRKSWCFFLATFLLVSLAIESGKLALPLRAAAAQQPEENAPPPEPNEAAPDAGPVEPAADAPPKEQSILSFFFGALGWTYTIAFLLISFTLVAFLVMNIVGLRRDAVCPQHIAEAFEANLNEKRFQEAFELAKSDPSMLGQMLAAGMQHLQQGYEKSLAAMAQVGEDENMKLEHRLSVLSIVGSIAPMVGLLGTVDGMVRSFMVIARSETQPKPSELAAGISTALITTLVGLVLAIPAIIAFNLLKNRLSRLVLETGQLAGNLMARFETIGKK
jgi:biopolymer transport protein ExbB